MSVAQLESKLMQLPADERREFARWFYEHESDIVDWDDGELSGAAKAEIIRRDREMDENPSLAVPVTDEWFDQLRKKLADARAVQKSAR
jgi:hypothetical protein